MIKKNKAVISKLIIHKIGNKFNNTRNAFSDEPVVFDEDSYRLMLSYLLKPFTNTVESFRFYHHADVQMNDMFNYSKQAFQEEVDFVELSQNIVQHLYEQSNSAQIKTGDVLVVLFDDIEYNDVNTSALGVFKIENKIDFFQTFKEGDSFDVMVQQGISTKKLDKGCLVINSTDDEGYVVLSVDNNNYDAAYWQKHFLNIKYADDKNNHTQTYMELCREFSEEVLQSDYGTQEKSNFLSKTVDFLKENDTVNIHDFKEEVFELDNHRALFDDYKKGFETDRDTVVKNQFHVSDAVVKKQKQKLKTEIKLDTNIQIKLDIDAPDASTEYLELGYDEDKKMKYYKVFFNEET